jgi:hypothetical protein
MLKAVELPEGVAERLGWANKGLEKCVICPKIWTRRPTAQRPLKMRKGGFVMRRAVNTPERGGQLEAAAGVVCDTV